MAEERGDSRFSSFLIGFLIGSLLAGGTATGYFVWNESRLTTEGRHRAEHAAFNRDHAVMVQAEARAARKKAEADRDRAERR